MKLVFVFQVEKLNHIVYIADHNPRYLEFETMHQMKTLPTNDLIFEQIIKHIIRICIK